MSKKRYEIRSKRVIGLIDRSFLLSHPRFHSKNLDFVIRILLENFYLLKFIFRIFHERLKALFNNLELNNANSITTRNEVVSYFTISYVPSISGKFKNITNDLGVRLSYYNLNRLRNFIKIQKDPLLTTLRNNVVYKINCNNCDASYVSQTGRQLKTKIHEQRNHIRQNTTTHSVITDHRQVFNHNFKWNEVEILDSKPIFHKRLISEMIYIKRQNSLNLRMDTENLQHTYVNVIDKLTKL